MNSFAWIWDMLRSAAVLIVAIFSYNSGKQATKEKIQETTLENIDKANKAIARSRVDTAYRDKLRKKYNIK